MRATIFGISGCTNGGKTTISKKLIEELKRKGLEVAHICQDDFFKQKEFVNQVSNKDSPDILFYHYDEIYAVDDKKMEESILEICMEKDIIIVEGNMVCELEKIMKLVDHLVFVAMDKDSCEERRKTRNYDPADLPGYFDQIVWPAYLSHYENAKKLETLNFPISFQNGTDILEEVIQKTLMIFEEKLTFFIKIQLSQIDARMLEKFVTLPNCGAVSTFIGTTRDNFKDKKVVSLEYECYESMAYKEIRRVCQKTKEKFPDTKRIAIFHRIGKVEVGESSIAISTSSPHRKEAIEATHFLIDTIKSCVPIFKKEVYEDGSTSWKENCEFEDFKKELGE